MRALVPFVLFAFVGCVADATAPDDEEILAQKSDALTIPSGIAAIRHWERPSDMSLVALTFDDGPDDTGGNTERILNTLKATGVKATFFINSRTGTNIRYSSEAKRLLTRMAAEGHVIGNHTALHRDMANYSSDTVELDLDRVEWDLKAAVPDTYRRPTLVRAPYGSPYLSGTQEQLNRIAPIVAWHGVHVGWSIDSLDWQCTDQGKGPSCVNDRVLYRIDLDRRGAILMHDTQKVTADALPTLIAEIQNRGLRFVTAEQLVRLKYGKSSYTLTQEFRAR
jgi:peptidoglycan-N-acetylglucosamine deacetylase